MTRQTDRVQDPPQDHRQGRIIERERMSPLPASYRAAVLTAAQDALLRRSRPHRLPERTVVVHGHRIATDQLEAYRRLFGSVSAVEADSVPSVLVHIAAFPAAMELMAAYDFPLPLLGLVHLQNRVWHHRPVPAEQPLEVAASATDLAPHPSGTTVELVVTVHAGGADASGEPELLWEGTSLYLARGVRLPGTRWPDRAQRAEFEVPELTAQWHLPASTGRDYAAVSGDYNPIHLHQLAARALGLKGMIAHGMYLAGRMLAGREPAEASHAWQIDFATVVLLPGTVSLNVAHPEPGRTEVTAWKPRTGKPHFTGWIQRD